MSDILSTYLGQKVENLPTPSFIIQREKFDKNCKLMLDNVKTLSNASTKNVSFRAHVKTHKTAKGTLKQLGHRLINTPYDSILVSTVKEAKGLLDYQESLGANYIKDIAFSLPACVPEVLKELSNISRRVDHFRVFVDNVQHINALGKFGKVDGKKWSVFLKVDMGTHRAGVVVGSKEFDNIIKQFKKSEVTDVVELYGIYAHAGHSYSSPSIIDTRRILLDEIRAVNESAIAIKKLLPDVFKTTDFVLSVGATPTSNSLRMTDEPLLIDYIKTKLVGTLEIHCGNYCLYDLQQLSTGCIKDFEIAGYVLGTIVSHYDEREESLTNTGVMALTRETSQYKGHGLCILPSITVQEAPYDVKYYIDRVSQEHGILKQIPSYKSPVVASTLHQKMQQSMFISSPSGLTSSGNFFTTPERESGTLPTTSSPASGASKTIVPDALGTKIAILPQHACIVMAQFPYYFVVNKENVVVDVWTPFQKW